MPIDLVYTWVDGSDPAWRKKYQEKAGSPPPDGRCTDAGELRASLASADRFAPWIRRIWIVSDNQTPAWIKEHPRARVVDHKAIIPGKYLPVFSSHAIEPHLFKIPGLAERFIYANDDMMFGAPVTRGQFFAPDGRPLVNFGDAARSGRGIHAKACANATDLLDKTFGFREWRNGWHQMTPYTKATLAEIAAKLPDAVKAASKRRTRSAKDVAWDAAFLASVQRRQRPRRGSQGQDQPHLCRHGKRRVSRPAWPGPSRHGRTCFA